MFFKVCGMRCQEDLDAAAGLGFAMAGFIFCEKSGRHLAPDRARQLATGPMLRVGVFVSRDADYIVSCAQTARVDLVQLHGHQDIPTMQEVAASLGRERIIRVLWPAGYASLSKMQQDMDALFPHCAAFLLDAGTSGGGHGTSLCLDFVDRVVFPRPWILAGGLDAQSLAKIAALDPGHRPAGLDFNSRLETAPGKKDARLMEELVQKARRLHLGPDGQGKVPWDFSRHQGPTSQQEAT